MDPHITPIFQSRPINQNIIQLEFKQAMRDFKEMFPTLDLDVIEMVLRQNQGAVDSSINQLLEISNSDNSKKFEDVDKSEASKNLNINSTPKEKIHKSTFNQLDLLSSNDQLDSCFNENSSATCSNQCTRIKSKWNPPLLGCLPDDFLRLNYPKLNNFNSNYFMLNERYQFSNYPNTSSNLIDASNLPKQNLPAEHLNHYILKQKLKENERQRSQLSSTLENNETAKYLEDERIAIMLQNEEFISDLRRNKEFMTALNYDSLIAANHQAKVRGFTNENYIEATNSNSYNFENNQNFSDADFKEHLRNMGKISRKKFAQLAGLFSRKKSNLPLRDNLLTSDDQYTQLENDCSDNEDSNQRKLKNQHTKN